MAVLTFLLTNWKYIVIALMAAIIGIQEMAIKQYKIDELQSKVKTQDHVISTQEKFSEIRNHKLSGSAVSKRMRSGSF